MKWVKQILWVLFFLWLVIAFLPKKNIYYALEHELKKEKIIFNKETLHDAFGFFTVHNPKVYYENIKVGNIDTISFVPLLFYNSISLGNAFFSDSMKQFVPKKIDDLSAKYTIFYPTVLFLSSNGDFGEIGGDFNVISRHLKLTLKPSKDFVKNYPALAQQFKKQNNEYIYETTFK